MPLGSSLTSLLRDQDTVVVLQVRNADGDLLGTFGPFTDYEANRYDADVPEGFDTEIVPLDDENVFEMVLESLSDPGRGPTVAETIANS